MLASNRGVAVAEQVGGELEPSDVAQRCWSSTAASFAGSPLRLPALVHGIADLAADTVRRVQNADSRSKQQGLWAGQTQPTYASKDSTQHEAGNATRRTEPAVFG